MGIAVVDVGRFGRPGSQDRERIAYQQDVAVRYRYFLLATTAVAIVIAW